MRAQRVAGDDAGQVLLLTIAYAVVALLLVTVIVSATAVHLDRKALVALADQAALAGAGALDLDRYYTAPSAGAPRNPDTGTSAAPPVALSDSSVAQAVQEYLDATAGDAGLGTVALAHAGTPDGATAEVTLRTLSRPALLSWVTAAWSGGVALEVTSRARAR